jgi:tetratricopeptide (TPR) repeat protein
MKLERFGDAEKSFRRAIEIDPRRLGAYQFLGFSLIRQGKGKEAITVLEGAAEFSRYQNLDILMVLGEARASTDDITGAIEAVNQALEVARRSRPFTVPGIEQRLRQLQAGNPGLE